MGSARRRRRAQRLPGFVARTRQLATKYGDHFTPPDSLVAKAERGETYE
ncbi:hypothetical protein [Rhodococcus erythropolis]|nr:hypothetical protein [Rhodococcus erythropolis]MDJ0015482.1 hypothetical protein [Rhodococcus erythropolis]